MLRSPAQDGGTVEGLGEVESAHLLTAGPGGCYLGERQQPDPMALPTFVGVAREQIDAWAAELVDSVRLDTGAEGTMTR